MNNMHNNFQKVNKFNIFEKKSKNVNCILPNCFTSYSYLKSNKIDSCKFFVIKYKNNLVNIMRFRRKIFYGFDNVIKRLLWNKRRYLLNILLTARYLNNKFFKGKLNNLNIKQLIYSFNEDIASLLNTSFKKDIFNKTLEISAFYRFKSIFGNRNDHKHSYNPYNYFILKNKELRNPYSRQKQRYRWLPFTFKQRIVKVQRKNFKYRMLKYRERFLYMYGNISTKKLYNFLKVIPRKDGQWGMFSILERRFDVFICRLHFMKSIFAAQVGIRLGFFTINSQVVRNPAFCISYNDVVSVRMDKRRLFQFKFLENFYIRSRLFFLPIPKHVYADFKLFEFFLIPQFFDFGETSIALTHKLYRRMLGKKN